MQGEISGPIKDHSFSTYTKFSEKNKHYFLPLDTHKRMCASQGVRNISFSEDFAYVQNE